MRTIILFCMLLVISNIAYATPNNIPVEIVEILDGDTVSLKIENNKFSLRLSNIDCYETSTIHRAYKQAYMNNLSIDEVIERGKKSKSYLEDLYKKTNSVYLNFKGIDNYGRALGILYFDELNVNEELKQNGGCMQYLYKH